MRPAGRAAIAILLLECCGAGCVFAGWGTYPLASGDGVEPYGLSSAKVTTADVKATVDVGVYNPTMAFTGIIVPIIPVWWVKYLSSVPERLSVAIDLERGMGSVEPDSLRVLIAAREYRASLTRVSQFLSSVDPSQPEAARDGGSIRYEFDDLPSPQEPFSIVVDGLPQMDFVLKRRWMFDVLDEH